MSLKHLTPTLETNDPAYDVSADAWNESHIMDDVSPPTPAAGKLAMLVKSIANVLFPSYIDPNAEIFAIQPHCIDKLYGYQQATGPNNVTINCLGSNTYNITGDPQYSFLTSSTLLTSRIRCDVAITSASTSAAAGYEEEAQDSFHSGSNGGFIVSITWGQSLGATNSTGRGFAGLQTGNGVSDVAPSSLINMMGMGWDSADTNIQFMHNDGSGTATKIDLGSSFPVPSVNNTSFYQVTISCAPGASTLYYRVKNMVTSAVATGSFSTNIPSSGTFLRRLIYTSVGGTSSTVGCVFISSQHSIG